MPRALCGRRAERRLLQPRRGPQLGGAGHRRAAGKALLYATADGGGSWQRQKTPAGTGECVAVDFASVRHGCVVTASGGLLGTSDGGQIWKRERHGMGALRLRDLDVPTRIADAAASTGGAAGGAIAKYTDPGTSWEDNWVYVVPFSDSATCPPHSSFTFKLSGYSLTADQPYDGWNAQAFAATSEDPAMFGIDFMAGRSNSSLPADWFNDYCDGVMIGLQTTASRPADLNFAFTGALTASGAYQIAFGQGHAGANDNWWAGGPTYSRQGTSGDPFLVTRDALWQIGVTGYEYEFNMSRQQGRAA